MSQSFWFSLLTIVPILVFVFVDAFAGVKTAVWSAIACAGVALGINIWLIKTMPHEPSLLDWATVFAEPLFIFVMGAITLKFSDPRYFKFQPVAVNAVMALLLVWGQAVGQPIMVKYFPVMEKMLDPEALQELLRISGGRDALLLKLAQVSYHMIYFFVAHGLLLAWAALKSKEWVWATLRILGIPLASVFMWIELII